MTREEDISEEARRRLEIFQLRMGQEIDGIKDPYINGGRQGSTGGKGTPNARLGGRNSYRHKSGQ
tara:strand:+ start:285 stop:479 length:195 start_codon:yes stop_codon:yes gene_type:complete